MQKKILLSTAVLLLSTTVFVANYSRAQSAHSDVDPNVSALSISLKSSNCYGHDNGKSILVLQQHHLSHVHFVMMKLLLLLQNQTKNQKYLLGK